MVDRPGSRESLSRGPQRAGIGTGHHSFSFEPPAELVRASNAVEVRRSLDGAVLEPRIDAGGCCKLRPEVTKAIDCRRLQVRPS